MCKYISVYIHTHIYIFMYTYIDINSNLFNRIQYIPMSFQVLSGELTAERLVALEGDDLAPEAVKDRLNQQITAMFS